MEKLNVQKPHFTPRVTESIEIMDKFVHDGLKEYTYEKDQDIRFNSSRHSKGRVFSQCINRDQHEVDRSTRDFVLWKSKRWVDKENKQHESIPGWHSECAAIAAHYLGSSIDLHIGGIDLMFPHHENEITLGRLYFKQDQWVKVCLYSGILYVSNEKKTKNGKKTKSEKMSKSLENFKTIEDLTSKGILPLAIRWHFMNHQYAKQMEFNEEAFKKSQYSYNKFIHHLTEIKQYLSETKNESFCPSELNHLKMMKEHLNDFLLDNLNLPKALQTVETYVQNLYLNEMHNMSRSGLKYCLDYILWITDKYFGLHEVNDDAANNTQLFGIVKHFRENVRKWTLKQMKQLGSNVKEEKLLLKFCDDVREQMNSIHYVVEDNEKRASSNEIATESSTSTLQKKLDDKVCRYPQLKGNSEKMAFSDDYLSFAIAENESRHPPHMISLPPPRRKMTEETSQT